MPEANDPLKPIEKGVVKIHDALTRYLKAYIKKLSSMIGPLASFVKEVTSAAKQLIRVVGKAAVETFIKAANRFLRIIGRLLSEAKGLLQFAKRILKMIGKATDPARIIKVLLTLLRKFSKLFKTIVQNVIELLSQIDVLGPVLKIIATFKTVLQLMLSWISRITGVVSLLQKAKTIVKKLVKVLKAELKELVQLVKEAGRIKLPAPA